jgi:hypothetical protein
MPNLGLILVGQPPTNVLQQEKSEIIDFSISGSNRHCKVQSILMLLQSACDKAGPMLC